MFRISKLYIGALCLTLVFCDGGRRGQQNPVQVSFDKLYGQIEVGGKFVGLEFHKSFPLPSRISFYYPAANSIDHSTDYWKRYESRPYRVWLEMDGKTDTLGLCGWPYRYAPHFAVFKKEVKGLGFSIRYDFADKLPAAIIRITVKNLRDENIRFKLGTALSADIKTSHTYAHYRKAQKSYIRDNYTTLVRYDARETGNAVIFMTNTGLKPADNLPPEDRAGKRMTDPVIGHSYQAELAPDDSIQIIQIIGSCRTGEAASIISRLRGNWRDEVNSYNDYVNHYAEKGGDLKLNYPALEQSARWSKAIIGTNRHYIDGTIVPMPCPAEYNFFFTHDLLLTGIGAGIFDMEYVQEGLRFLMKLSKADSILAHAYYWKDSTFVTEFCQADNWNHLWITIASGAYLRHSADTAIVRLVYPVMKKSLEMMLTNMGPDSVMYAIRPDWWDAGNVYGPRVYITVLTIRAIDEFSHISHTLKTDEHELPGLLSIRDALKKNLVNRFWQEDQAYLMNKLTPFEWDGHFYSGSLVAAMYNLLDDDKSRTLIKTAENILLEPHIGIRNAMPDDFHLLEEKYNLKAGEAGRPGYYFNGGVWPQGTAWYIEALIQNNQPDKALAALEKYLSLAGILNSPNGQPSFYECRITNTDSAVYGAIDKPTFLWFGAFYLRALHLLAGLRENTWNIGFDPVLPSAFDDIAYHVNLYGRNCRIGYQGKGAFFSHITIDGAKGWQSVFNEAHQSIRFTRGAPAEPYISAAECLINKVLYECNDGYKTISFTTQSHQNTPVTIGLVSPWRIKSVTIDNREKLVKITSKEIDGVYKHDIVFTADHGRAEMNIRFENEKPVRSN